MGDPEARRRRLAALARGLGARSGLRLDDERQPLPAAVGGSSAPLTVGFAGVHRSIPEPPASAGGGGAGGPENPGGHNWASGVAQLSSADVTVTCCYDYDAGVRDAFSAAWGSLWPGVKLHARLEDLLADPPDILCLATAQGLHAEHIEAAAAAGVRGLVVEKPLCTRLAEADRIFAATERHGVRLANGTELRWDRAYTRLAALIADGLVGTVTHVTAMGVGDLINHGACDCGHFLTPQA
eukprot:COSAG04_NODE_265_length_18593_cov_4.226776_8_plen_240_part_00